MAKALKPLMIAVCVLSIGALALGVMLFLQREQVKGRVTKLERSHQDIASAIQYEDLSLTRLKEYEAMDSQIRGLNQATRNTFDELVTTSNTLVETRTTLASTEADLETTRSELSTSETKVADLEDETTRKNTQIARQSNQITDLETTAEELTFQVDGLENEVEITLARLGDAEQRAQFWKAEHDKQVESFARRNSDGTSFEDSNINFEGRVLLVADDWNYVIIDGGKDSELTDNVHLLVFRGGDPVGKIKVRRVEDDVAIAEIVKKWEGRSPTAGDEVISPGGAS